MRGSHTLTVAVLAAGASIFLGSCTTPLSIDRGARAPQLDGFGTVAMTAITVTPINVRTTEPEPPPMAVPPTRTAAIAV